MVHRLGAVVLCACLCVPSSSCSQGSTGVAETIVDASSDVTHGFGGEGGSGAPVSTGGIPTVTDEGIDAGVGSGISDRHAPISDGGLPQKPSCTFTQSARVSAKMATVAVVSWTTSLAHVTEARIDFGLDTSYGMAAPVSTPLSDDNVTTLLLGMKQNRTYHYRISATNGAGSCTSEDYTIVTGSLPSGVPKIKATTHDASALYGGFLLTGRYIVGVGASTAPAYIVDRDGDVVWAYLPGSNVLGLVMSYDGSRIWINSNSSTTSKAHVHRLSMDGLTVEDLSPAFAGLNHQLTVLPDETVAFYAYGANGCDDVKEYAPDGTVKTLVNAGTAQGETGGCHLNNIQYSKDDDTLVFSDLYHQTVVKIRRSDGATVWVLGGTKPTSFTGDTWVGGQHGIHILGLDDFLIFNNNTKGSNGGPAPLGGSGDGSVAAEYRLDLLGMKVSRVWSYKANPGVQSDIMGDLQRLPNGNTVVAYSYAGVVQEVSASGVLLQQLTWPSGTAFSYIQKRATLYGPPPR
jgi:hypothetical protein